MLIERTKGERTYPKLCDSNVDGNMSLATSSAVGTLTSTMATATKTCIVASSVSSDTSKSNTATGRCTRLRWCVTVRGRNCITVMRINILLRFQFVIPWLYPVPIIQLPVLITITVTITKLLAMVLDRSLPLFRKPSLRSAPPINSGKLGKR